jgi:hypothetical protein
MIVTKNPEGWNIFFHRTHALLAFKIGINIKQSYWPIPRFRLDGLSAITGHDDFQPDWNKRDNLTKAGAPLDFRQPSSMALKEVNLMINRSLYKSAFMTLMISMHCRSIYKDQKGQEIEKFMDEQEALCKSIIKHLEINLADACGCYQVLRFCDELSLMLCQGDMPKQGRKIQLEKLPGIRENFIRKDDEGILRLDQWCFETPEFTISSEYYSTKKLRYNSDHELISELSLGSPNFINFEFGEA